MSRNTFSQCGLTLILAFINLSPLSAQSTQPEQPPVHLLPFAKFSKTPEIIQRLQTEIDTKDFQESMKLSEALELLHDSLAAKKKAIDFYFDEETFKAETPISKDKVFTLKAEPTKEDPALLDTKVKLASLPKKMTAESILKILVGQLTKYKGTYLIRNKTVVITTAKQASIKSLLQEKVAASFHKVTLVEAIYTLSDQTGASIAFDPKIVERAFAPVTATFAHDTTLDSALTLLTDMAGLRFVVLGDGIYVTSFENADKLRYQPK